MRNAMALVLIAAAALACRGRTAPAQRTQQQYDVVQEGQTTSATSTIDAPGEVRPPIATATNTDTTGSFTLPTTTVPPPIVITTRPRPIARRPPPADTAETNATNATDTTDTTPPPPTVTDTIGNLY
jgi:hypothetical protein